eukprot:1106047-Rhodomonas_salina.1
MDGQQGGDVYFERTPTMFGDSAAPYERTGCAVVRSLPTANALVQHVDGSYQLLQQIDVIHSTKLLSFKLWHSIFYFFKLNNVAANNALHLWSIENPAVEELFTQSLCIWIAGLIEEILDQYGGKCGPIVTDLQPEAGPALRPDCQYWNAGCMGESHLGPSPAQVGLADTRMLTEHHFADCHDRKGNCALCCACLPSKKGEKQVIWKCDECNGMLHIALREVQLKPETLKKNPKSPFV